MKSHLNQLLNQLVVFFQADDEKLKNRGHGDDILNVNSSKTDKRLFGNGILEDAGAELLEGEETLSNISDSKIGSHLTSLENELHTALYELIESGFAQLQIDGDWLEIELNSALLFPSGSASVTNSAVNILGVIYDVIGEANNFVRVRGYTDDQMINNEIFSSNWELSVAPSYRYFKSIRKTRCHSSTHGDRRLWAILSYGRQYNGSRTRKK